MDVVQRRPEAHDGARAGEDDLAHRHALMEGGRRRRALDVDDVSLAERFALTVEQAAAGRSPADRQHPRSRFLQRTLYSRIGGAGGEEQEQRKEAGHDDTQ